MAISANSLGLTSTLSSSFPVSVVDILVPNTMAGTTESPGASQSGSIIACAVVMFLLAMIASGLRAYTRFFIVRVASYEELLVGLAVVSSLFVCRSHGQADQDRS